MQDKYFHYYSWSYSYWLYEK